MAHNFEWQTDEDEVWADLPEKSPQKPPARGRRWLLLVITLLLVVSAVGYVIYQIDRRADENLKAIQADVLSSHNLLTLAVVEADSELFNSLLSGRDPGWTAAQERLFASDLILNRRPFDLLIRPLPTASLTDDADGIALEMSPDLLEAVLTVDQPFDIYVGNGVTETVTLQQTAVYRLGRARWLLAPPLPSFWGASDATAGSMLMLSYPARDAILAQRLHGDLERKLQEMCTVLSDLDCANFTYAVEFSTDPATLDAAQRPIPVEQNAERLTLTLPTPTLVGLPQDESAYEALARGYAIQMVTAVVAHLSEYECCVRAPFFQALLDYRLSELALRPWPVTDASYQRLLAERINLADLSALWNLRNAAALRQPQNWPVYALIDYLLQMNPEVGVADMQRQLEVSPDFTTWLTTLYGDETAETSRALEDLSRRWWLYAYDQAYGAPQVEATALPQQSLGLICLQEENDGIESGGLYRYELAADRVTLQHTIGGFGFLSPLPTAGATLLEAFDAERNAWLPYLLRDAEKIPLAVPDASLFLSFGQMDPTGKLLTAYTSTQSDESLDVLLLELDECIANGCTGYTVPGMPAWSPDGAQALLSGEMSTQFMLLPLDTRTISIDPRSAPQSATLYRAGRETLLQAPEATDLQAVGNGYAPFWLDKETYGYVVAQSGSETAVVLAQTRDDQPEILIEDAALEAALPPEGETRDLVIHYALVPPHTQQSLYVVASALRVSQVHVFSVDLAGGNVRWLLQQAGPTSYHSLGFSPDGRYLVLTAEETAGRPWIQQLQILLHDIGTGHTIPFQMLNPFLGPLGQYDWTADGRWLAFMSHESALALLQPESGVLRVVDLEVGGCVSPVWLP